MLLAQNERNAGREGDSARQSHVPSINEESGRKCSPPGQGLPTPPSNSRRIRTERLLLVIVLTLFYCLPVQAQVKRTCGRAKKDPNRHNIEDCLKEIAGIFDRKGLHPVLGSVVPGSGLGGGIGYKAEWKTGSDGDWQHQFKAAALVTYRKYWKFDANWRINKLAGALTQSELESESPVEKSRPKGNVYFQVKDMPRLDFFGLGPETQESGLAKFHYREIVAGADLAKPLSDRVNVGGAFEVIWPRLENITDPTVRPVQQVYTEPQAPGLNARPNYLHYVAFLGVHTRSQPEVRRLDYRAFYHFYHDVSEHRYSFRRLEVRLFNVIPFGKIISDPQSSVLLKRSEIRLNGRLSLSYTNSGQRVPFYLQETLGGSNIWSEDTLRGFRDYRFRDRDLILLQTEYLFRLNSPLALSVFYDTGKVMPRLRDTDVRRLRHTVGAGLVAILPGQNKTVFRLYVAFGSGEGTHTLIGGGDIFGGSGDRLIR
jgi:hypothetical protein